MVAGANEARDGQIALGEHFPAGAGSPVMLLIDEGDIRTVVSTLEANDGVDQVMGVSAIVFNHVFQFPGSDQRCRCMRSCS